MKDFIGQLFILQGIELGPDPATAENKEAIARLRQKIPPQIIAHYDRLRERGKNGVALVRHGVCCECHMRLSSGTHAQLLRREDVIICGSCGRYLHTVDEPLPEIPAPATDLKTPEKKRKRKKAADAV